MRAMVWGAAAISLLVAANVRALPPDVVDHAQRATALVQLSLPEGRSYGSAFCVNDKKTFITDAHVVIHKGNLKVVVRPGEKDERILNAHVRGIDYEADLAVLQTEKSGDVEPMVLGSSDNLSPTQDVTAFGYPFGKMLSLDKDTFPSISVNTGKITALRKEKGELRLIQMDALVNPGDSGGPVLDGQGKIIGIVESGVPGAGLNFATPVARLAKMLQEPLLVIDPIEVEYAQRTKQRTFAIRVHSLTHDASNYDVELKITDAKGGTQTATGKTASGKCELTLAPTADESAVKWNPFAEPPPKFKFALTLKSENKVAALQSGDISITNVPVATEIVKVKQTPQDHKNGNMMDPLPSNAAETAIIGPEKADPMRAVLAAGQLAIGVKYATADWNGKPVIAAIQLFHQKPAGDKWQLVTAKEGYVVGGMIVETDQFVNGFKVIFIRKSKSGKLDPSDTYTSDWAGRSAGGQGGQLAGKGERVIGLCGRKGTFVRAIGLVIEKSSDPAATQPAKK